MGITVDIDIHAPKEQVWAAISDIGQSATMISGIVAVDILHKPESGLVGLKWTETRVLFGKNASETMWITDCEEGVYYSTRAENHGAVYTSTLSLKEQHGLTRLTHSFSATSGSIPMKIIAWVMGFAMNRSMTKLLLADVNDIKSFVESRA